MPPARSNPKTMTATPENRLRLAREMRAVMREVTDTLESFAI